jgi:protein-disulfide isomerase
MVVSSTNSNLNVNKVDTNTIQTANSQDGGIADHVFGKVGSKVTLIEYGDYQCPPCGAMFPVVKDVTEYYQNQLQYVFRNFPIPSLHPNAMAAAASAEAAGLQGKYWQMHNKLYDTQSDWSDLSATDRT